MSPSFHGRGFSGSARRRTKREYRRQLTGKAARWCLDHVREDWSWSHFNQPWRSW